MFQLQLNKVSSTSLFYLFTLKFFKDVKWVAFNEKNPEQAAFDIKKI